MRVISIVDRFSMGALGLSLVLHVVIFVLVGGVVIFEAPILRSPFVIEDIGISFNDQEDESLMLDESTEPEIPVLETELDIPTTENLDEVAMPDIVLPDVIVAKDVAIPVSHSVISTTGPLDVKISQSPVMAQATQNRIQRATQKMVMQTFLGSNETVDGALQGYMYDLKQTPERQLSSIGERFKNITGTAKSKEDYEYYYEVLRKFVKSWSVTVLNKYFRSPRPLSAAHLVIPYMEAELAPKAFNLQKQVNPKYWLIYYSGSYSPPESGTYRFVGLADDILLVRFNNKLVLEGSLKWHRQFGLQQEDVGSAIVKKSKMVAGPWINMNKGTNYPVEILLGEIPGGVFYGFLLFQKKGEEYEMKGGTPVLPPFRVMEANLPKVQPGSGPPILRN